MERILTWLPAALTGILTAAFTAVAVNGCWWTYTLTVEVLNHQQYSCGWFAAVCGVVTLFDFGMAVWIGRACAGLTKEAWRETFW